MTVIAVRAEPELQDPKDDFVPNVITGSLMQVWFKMRSLNGSHVEVKTVGDYKFLNSSYVPVL